MVVQITSSGEKYHLDFCSYLHSSSRAISLKEAAAKGYGRCSRCKPPRYISEEDYLNEKASQHLILRIIAVPIMCALITLFIVLILAKIGEVKNRDYFCK